MVSYVGGLLKTRSRKDWIFRQEHKIYRIQRWELYAQIVESMGFHE